MTNAVARAWDRQVAADWSALPIDVREPIPRARAVRVVEHLPDAEALLAARLNDVSCGICDANSPMAVDEFEEVVRSQLRLGHGGHLGGFTQYSDTLRQLFLEMIFVQNSGNHVEMGSIAAFYCRLSIVAF